MASKPKHHIFDPVRGGPVPLGSFGRTTSRGVRFRLEVPAPAGQTGTRHFIFEPMGGGPVVLGGAGRSKGTPSKITLTGTFVEVDDDDD